MVRYRRNKKEGRSRPSLFFPRIPPSLDFAELGRNLLLTPPARAYALYRRLSTALRERGLLPHYHPGAVTVAVGGLRPDSGGRLLLTSWLLGWAASRGVTTAVTFPQGEAAPPQLPWEVEPGADPWTCGPEAALLARYLPQGHLLVDGNAVRAAKTAVARFDPQLLVLQDGLTENRLARDINLAILDPRDLGPDWNRTVPAGPWRGDVSFLERATAFCVHAGPQGLPSAMAAAEHRLTSFDRPVFGLTFALWRFRSADGPVTAETIAETPYIAVLGESDRTILPEALRQKIGIAPRMIFYVHDRHRFTRQNFEHLRLDADRLRAPTIVTSPSLELKLRDGRELLSGLTVCTYDPEVVFAGAQGTDLSFLDWWEAAYAATALRRSTPGADALPAPPGNAR